MISMAGSTEKISGGNRRGGKNWWNFNITEGEIEFQKNLN